MQPNRSFCNAWLVLGGNESGVASEQTFDRVESTQGAETRAARCEHCTVVSKQH